MYVAGDIVGFRAVFTAGGSDQSGQQGVSGAINNLFEAGGGPERLDEI